MADTPEAPAEAPKAPESVETPTTTNNNEPAPAQTLAPAQATDMHGFTSEQLADMKKFFDNNGGFDAIKSKISNPEKTAGQTQDNKPVEENPTSHTQEPQVPKTPAGAITAQEFLAQQYFQSLAKEEKYAPIAKGIQNGEYLKEMAAFGINVLNQDGSINNQKVRMYLDLKAQTVPASPTGVEPNANTAPTVDYYQVEGDKVTKMDDAYKILQQDMQLQAAGQGHHPLITQAEEFIKTGGKPVEKTETK